MSQQFPTNHNFCLKVVTGRLVLLQAILKAVVIVFKLKVRCFIFVRNIKTGRSIKVCFLTKKSKCFTKRVILKLSHSVSSPSDEVRNYPAHWRMKNQPNPINGSV